MRPRRRTRPCGMPWFPHGLKRARLYAAGWRCDRCAPWALAGREEPRPEVARPRGGEAA